MYGIEATKSMHSDVYKVFEDICGKAGIVGPVLEVGAVPGQASLLRMACLRNASQLVGINLCTTSADESGEITQGNANHMREFADGYFEAVICNALLEHDLYFVVMNPPRIIGWGRKP